MKITGRKLWLGDVNDIMHRKRTQRILKKMSVSWVLWSEEEGWLSLARGCHTCLWGEADEKANLERLCLSPYFEKPLKSKVIKSFVLELRSRYLFFMFPDSYVLCIYVTNILCTFHISIYGYVTGRWRKSFSLAWQTSFLVSNSQLLLETWTASLWDMGFWFLENKITFSTFITQYFQSSHYNLDWDWLEILKPLVQFSNLQINTEKNYWITKGSFNYN